MYFFLEVLWSHLSDTTLWLLYLCNDNKNIKCTDTPAKVYKMLGWMLLQGSTVMNILWYFFPLIPESNWDVNYRKFSCSDRQVSYSDCKHPVSRIIHIYVLDGARFYLLSVAFPNKMYFRSNFLHSNFYTVLFNNVINRSVPNCFITFLILATVNTQHYLSGVWVPSLLGGDA